MCGRYTLDGENTQMRDIVHTIQQQYPNLSICTGDIFPGCTTPLLLGETLIPTPGLWGFPPFFGSRLLINARAETVTQKNVFRQCLQNGRCAVPSTGFYEWSSDKTAYFFRLPDKEEVFFAGLYRFSGGVLRYVILTTKANDSVSPIHHRMPLILTEQTLPAWMDKSIDVQKTLSVKMPLLKVTPVKKTD